MSDNYIPVDTDLDVQSGFAFPSTSFEENGIPIVRMSDLKTGKLVFNNTKYVSNKWLKTASAFTLKSGDFLMGMSGSLTNFAVVSDDNIPSLLNQRVGRLKLKNTTVNYNYVCYWLKSEKYECYAEIQGEGAAQKNISAKQIGQFLYRDAPILEQNKIAFILQTIDQTIEKTEALIEKYQQIKAGLMHDLFTRGITAGGKLRPPREQAPELYQETPIGWIPKDWELTNLAQTLSRIDSGWSPACPETTPTIGEWGVLKVSAVTKGYYDYRESKTLPPPLKPQVSIEVHDGDVILTRANGVAKLVGKTVQVKNTQNKLMLSDKLLRLVPKPEIVTNDYLSLLMNSHNIKSQIEKTMSGSSGQKNISQSEIRSFEFYRPKMDEQELAAGRFGALEVLITREKKTKDKFKNQKAGLMHDLLTGKVSVKMAKKEALYT